MIYIQNVTHREYGRILISSQTRLIIFFQHLRNNFVLTCLIRRIPRWTVQLCPLLPPPRSAPTLPCLCSAWLPARRLTQWVKTHTVAHKQANRHARIHTLVYQEPSLLCFLFQVMTSCPALPKMHLGWRKWWSSWTILFLTARVRNSRRSV